MNGSFRMFPEAASHGAWEVDYLTFALLAITTFFSLGISLAIVFFVGRYWHTREVNRVSSHSNLLHWAIEMTWSIGPLIILMILYAWGAAVFLRAHQPPDDAIDIYIVAKQWMWKIGHQNGRREINTMHVPVGTPVRLTMISEDVIHSMFLPAFRIKQDVIPGRYTTLWFEATKPGTYHLFCAEYCGTDHSHMRGKVVVQTRQDFARWLEDENVESMAQRGRRRVEALGCLKCHGENVSTNLATLHLPENLSHQDESEKTSAGSEAPTQIGPPLTGLYGSRVPLSSGGFATADDSYIRRALVDPRSQTRAGYAGIMPSYDGQLEPEQILEITAYIRSIADATGPLAGPGTPSDETRGDLPANAEKESKTQAKEPKDGESDADRGAPDQREEQTQ